MLYTIIDLYEVLRTDEIYPDMSEMSSENCSEQEQDGICTDPYRYLHDIL